MNHFAGDQFWVKASYLNALDKDAKKILLSIKKKTQLKSDLSSFFRGIKYRILNKKLQV